MDKRDAHRCTLVMPVALKRKSERILPWGTLNRTIRGFLYTLVEMSAEERSKALQNYSRAAEKADELW